MVFRDINPKVSIPLFKYYGNIAYAKDAIENDRIHLEAPATYNDIYDSSNRIVPEDLYRMMFGNFLHVPSVKKYCDFLDYEEIEELRKKNYSIGKTIDCICNLNKKVDRDELIKEALLICTRGNAIYQADNNKISCFSEVNDSLLMWAYYANNYSGVCIRFNAINDAILSKHCRKVQYTNHYISDNGFSNYFRKSIQWSHEQEWRIVCDTEQEYIPVNSIDAIYIGLRMRDDIAQELMLLGEKKGLEVYKMNISDIKYEILFDRVR